MIPDLDDLIGGICIAVLMWGLPWVAAIAQAVLQ